MNKLALIIIPLLVLNGCAATPGQNQYTAFEAGQVIETEFGTVVDITPIHIQNTNTGVGAGAGALAGAGAGSAFGSGNGQIAAALIGAIAGAVAGSAIEQNVQNKDGLSYTVTLKKGKTVTVAQYFKEGDPVIKVGERVMVQTSGAYMRVLPAKHLPTKIKKPQDISVE